MHLRLSSRTVLARARLQVAQLQSAGGFRPGYHHLHHVHAVCDWPDGPQHGAGAAQALCSSFSCDRPKRSLGSVPWTGCFGLTIIAREGGVGHHMDVGAWLRGLGLERYEVALPADAVPVTDSTAKDTAERRQVTGRQPRARASKPSCSAVRRISARRDRVHRLLHTRPRMRVIKPSKDSSATCCQTRESLR
jgi:hypothetical protein